MLHGLTYALLFPMGSILISMGEMWFSWVVNLLNCVFFALAAWFLVPRYGAVGYASAMAVSFALGNIPCVIFLYRRIPEVMHFLRWALIATAIAALFAGCVLAFHTLSFVWATAVGIAAVIGFLLLKLKLTTKL
jgi:O-antigen/teichoic acid export membrane protein